jgi:hypothetical protein
MISSLTLPFVRFTGDYMIKYAACAISAEGKSEIFMETDPIRRGHLQEIMEKCGAKHVIIHSFPRNDSSRLANKFLGRVQKLAEKGDGVKLFTRGKTEIEASFDSGALEPNDLARFVRQDRDEEVSLNNLIHAIL